MCFSGRGGEIRSSGGDWSFRARSLTQYSPEAGDAGRLPTDPSGSRRLTRMWAGGTSRWSRRFARQDLDRVISSSDLMPPGTDIQPLGHREYGLLAPGMAERRRVTTDPGYYEEHSESVELWSPGNLLFTPPEFVAQAKEE